MTEVFEQEDGSLLVPESDPLGQTPKGSLVAVDRQSDVGRAWLASIRVSGDQPQREGLLLVDEHEGRRYEIIREFFFEIGEGGIPARYWAWYYLFRFDGLDPGSPNTHDFLVETAEIAKETARDDFGVPVESWLQAAPADERPNWYTVVPGDRP